MGEQGHGGRGLWPLLIAWLTYGALAYAVWGPWVPSPTVANTLLGVDMAEAVKFLPQVRSGQISVHREVFLLPQMLLAFTLAIHAWQRRWSYPTWLRVLMQLAAVVTALSLLPPPWSPALLRAPEWRVHTALIGITLAVALFAPLWARWPARWLDRALGVFALLTGTWVGAELQQVWPDFIQVYHRSLNFGGGVWALGLGVTGLLLFAIVTINE